MRANMTNTAKASTASQIRASVNNIQISASNTERPPSFSRGASGPASILGGMGVGPIFRALVRLAYVRWRTIGRQHTFLCLFRRYKTIQLVDVVWIPYRK